MTAQLGLVSYIPKYSIPWFKDVVSINNTGIRLDCFHKLSFAG